MAMLTGKMQTQAMRIYAVSHSGRLSDVTSQTTCHSGDEAALKVYHHCSSSLHFSSRNFPVFGNISVKFNVEQGTKMAEILLMLFTKIMATNGPDLRAGVICMHPCILTARSVA